MVNRSKKAKWPHQHGRNSWSRTVVLMGLSMALMVIFSGSFPVPGSRIGLAQTSNPNAPVNFQSGQVTGKSETSVQISGKNYPLKKGVVIKDDEEKLRTDKELVPGTEVRFHLKQDEIDQIVIILPK